MTPTTACRQIIRSEDANSLVELALIISFLGIPLLLGTTVMATVIYGSIEISNAAHAGAVYAMQSSTFAANTSGIIDAAQSEAADFATALAVVPTTYYVCANSITGTQYTGSNAQSNATTACTGGGDHAVQFVQVATSAVISPRIHMPGLASTYTVKGVSVMEVEQ